MDNILLMPLSTKTVPKWKLEMLRAEQLSRFAGKVERAILRATETDNFTKRLCDSDTDEFIRFFDACAEVYNDHSFEIENLHKNRAEYQKLNSIYGKYILPEQRYIDNVLLVIMREFDSTMPELIADQFEDANEIIKNINRGKFDQEWYILYDLYQMMKMDNLASVVSHKMAELGDTFAQNIISNEGQTYSFDELNDMLERSYEQSYEPNENVINFPKTKNDNEPTDDGPKQK